MKRSVFLSSQQRLHQQQNLGADFISDEIEDSFIDNTISLPENNILQYVAHENPFITALVFKKLRSNSTQSNEFTPELIPVVYDFIQTSHQFLQFEATLLLSEVVSIFCIRGLDLQQFENLLEQSDEYFQPCLVRLFTRCFEIGDYDCQARVIDSLISSFPSQSLHMQKEVLELVKQCCLFKRDGLVKELIKTRPLLMKEPQLFAMTVKIAAVDVLWAQNFDSKMACLEFWGRVITQNFNMISDQATFDAVSALLNVLLSNVLEQCQIARGDVLMLDWARKYPVAGEYLTFREFAALYIYDVMPAVFECLICLIDVQTSPACIENVISTFTTYIDITDEFNLEIHVSQKLVNSIFRLMYSVNERNQRSGITVIQALVLSGYLLGENEAADVAQAMMKVKNNQEAKRRIVDMYNMVDPNLGSIVAACAE